MKNALDFVKPMADLVTEYDNNQSGVGRVLKKYLQRNWQIF